MKKKDSQSNEFSDSSGREVAELDLKQGKAGKGPAANVLVLNLVARFYFVGMTDFVRTNKFRSLKGLPISLRTRRQLEKLPPASLKLLQVQLFPLNTLNTLPAMIIFSYSLLSSLRIKSPPWSRQQHHASWSRQLPSPHIRCSAHPADNSLFHHDANVPGLSD